MFNELFLYKGGLLKMVSQPLANSLITPSEFKSLSFQNIEEGRLSHQNDRNKKAFPKKGSFNYKFGTPKGIRTPVTAVKRRCPRPG